MPDYIKLCMQTWKLPYIVLNFQTVNLVTKLPLEQLRTFTYAQISDVVRAHVLRDRGGYWLDADTIMLTDKLPEENIIGDPITRTHSTGLSHYTEEAKDFFEKWAEYQDRTIADANHSTDWSVLVNMFTDTYVPYHKEVTIHDITEYRPELNMIADGTSREKYERFYFGSSYHLSDIQSKDILVLHNSWTPDWYKRLTTSRVLNHNCTISNILREALR